METKITEKAKDMVIGYTVSSLPEEWNGVTYAKVYDLIMRYDELPEDLVFCEQYDYLNLTDIDIVKRQLEDFYDSLYRDLFKFAIELLETKKLLPEKPKVQLRIESEGDPIVSVASNIPNLDFIVFNTETEGLDEDNENIRCISRDGLYWNTLIYRNEVEDENEFYEIEE